jgi:hypothetical protein
LEYLINSERVIAADPAPADGIRMIPAVFQWRFDSVQCHEPRRGAIEFAENLPSSRGLYKDLRVSFYNSLDITGKFVEDCDALVEWETLDIGRKYPLGG